MTSAIDRDDFDFENVKYRPELSFPDHMPTIGADRMLFHFSNSLENRAVLLGSQSNFSTYLIDTSIKAKIPSENFRQEKIDHWKTEHTQAKKWAWLEGVSGILAAGAIGFFAMTNMTRMALGVCSIGLLTFAGMNIFSQAKKAKHQIDGWSTNPLAEIAEARTRAYKKEFPYVLSHDLKLRGLSHFQILLPEEVLFLFERYFDKFCANLLSAQPSSEKQIKEWLDSFTYCNPVSNKALTYAYNQVPDKYLRVSYDFEVLYKQLTDLRGEFNKLRNQREKETAVVIKNINRNRDLALEPFAAACLYYKKQASNERDAKLQKTTKAEERTPIYNEYRASIAKYQAYHAAAIIPVNLIFNNQVRDAEASLESILKEIKKNEASSHAPYFNYAWGLLDYAKKVKEQPNFVYQPQIFTSAEAFQIPAPFVPPVININFIQQAGQQAPVNVDASQYADYLRYVQGQRN